MQAMTDIKASLLDALASVKSSANESLRDTESYLAKVKKDGLALEHVPAPLKTPELCLVAVQQDGCSLEFVPELLKTPELLLAAVMQNGFALQYSPEHLRTPELCFSAVMEDGRALYYVPETLKTPEICLAAVRRSGFSRGSVPVSLSDFVDKFKNWNVFSWTPENYAIEALKSDASYLPFLAPDMINSGPVRDFIFGRLYKMTEATSVEFMEDLIRRMDEAPVAHERPAGA